MIGQRHTSGDGYTFLETEHGPNVEGRCVDCGGRAYHALEAAERVAPRCSTCARARHGVTPSVKSRLVASARLGQGGANAHPQAMREGRLPIGPMGGPIVAMVRPVGVEGCPPAARELWRQLVARRRPVRALHTVAVVKGALDERVSVQSRGIIATWKRSAARRKPSLMRTATGRPRPFVPGVTEYWAGTAIVRYRKMTITRLMTGLRDGEF